MIYFKNAENAKTVNQLLKLGYNHGQLFTKTFDDPEFKNLQCDNARRSFYDLLEICQTYFPKTKKERLAKILTKKYFSFYCKSTDLLVFMLYIRPGFEDLMGAIYTADFKDQTGLSYNKVLKFLDD